MTDKPKAILLDIEGTTSSISFVADELFPYARKHLAEFVANNPEVAAPILAQVPGDDDPVATLLAWIDEDLQGRTPLKTLQGMIWAQGYARRRAAWGHVYPDDARGAAPLDRGRSRGEHLFPPARSPRRS